MTRAGTLLALGARLARARWRLVLRHRHGPAGLVVGGVGTVFAWTLLVFAAAAFIMVGTTLLAALLGRGHGELALAVAGAIADAATILAILAVAAAEETRRGIPPLPLATLPVRPGDLLLAELAGLLLVEPLAAVAWPAALVFLLGPAQAFPRAALLMVLPATGFALFLGVLGLVLRRLVLDRARRRLPGSLLATGLVFAAPAAWLAGNWQGAGNLLQLQAGPWSPGWWIRQALREALAGRPDALLPGGVFLLLAFGGLALAAPRAGSVPLPGGSVARRSPRPLAPAFALAAAPPVVSQWTGSTAAALLVLVTGNALVRQGLAAPTVVRGTALLAALVAAGAPAPLLANLLGIGGRGPLGLLLAGARPGPLLARLAAATLAPVLLVLPVLGLACAWLLPGTAPALLLAGALAALGAGAGAGFLLSVAWPVRLPLELPGTPLWPPGPSRWIMLGAQGASLAPFLGGGRAGTAAVAAVAIGVAAAAGGWWVAHRRLRRALLEVTGNLLT